jgi:hypothetical protein
MPFDPILAAKQANFVQFAYNMFTAEPNSLRPAVDPGLATAGFDLVSYLSAHDLQDVKFYGYLAAETASPGNLVIAIRGTETPAEWLLDFDALPLPYLGKGMVAGGFRAIAQSFQFMDLSGAVIGDLPTTLAARNTATPITSITVLGHSLGAALATLAAAQIAFSNTPTGGKLELATYASPRVGLLDFMTSFNHAVPTAFRIWNTLDVVPQVPTFPYVHVGQSEELKQTQAQLQHLKVTPSCEHHLGNYQWLLDPAHFAVNAPCVLAAPLAAHAIGGAVAVTETTLGAAALATAMHQVP